MRVKEHDWVQYRDIEFEDFNFQFCIRLAKLMYIRGCLGTRIAIESYFRYFSPTEKAKKAALTRTIRKLNSILLTPPIYFELQPDEIGKVVDVEFNLINMNYSYNSALPLLFKTRDNLLEGEKFDTNIIPTSVLDIGIDPSGNIRRGVVFYRRYLRDAMLSQKRLIYVPNFDSGISYYLGQSFYFLCPDLVSRFEKWVMNDFILEINQRILSEKSETKSS